MKKRIIIWMIALFAMTGKITYAQSWSSVAYMYNYSSFGCSNKFLTWNDSMYTIGTFTNLNSDTTRNFVARWDGANWSTVGDPYITGLGVYAGCVYNNELYIAGEFSKINNIPARRLARWNGAKWDSVAGGIGYFPNPSPAAMCVYNNELYIGGGYGLAKWNGSTYTLISNTCKSISSMIVFNGELYIGGGTAGEFAGSPHIIKYNGSNFSNVGVGFDKHPGTVIKTMAIHNNELYVGGDLDSSGTNAIDNLARWDGTEWRSLKPSEEINAGVRGLASDGTKLYITGNFWMVGSTPCNRALSWDGTNYTVMGSATGGEDAHIYHNKLYTGGCNVSRWSGTIVTTGVAENNAENGLSVYPNPFSSETTFKTKESLKEATLTIYNSFGQEVKRLENISGEKVVLHRDKLTNGMYFICLTQDDKVIATKKLVITD